MAKLSAYNVIKRGIDIAGSAVIMGLTCPAWAVISVMIRAESRGSAIFVHERVGLRGRHIKVYKFRSMETGADDLESTLNDEDLEAYYQEYKLKDDPRVTEIGRFLRRTSLDELPQLINVLQGNMSLVGPRPVMEDELGNYSPEEVDVLLSVKPGITGYWQVFGRNEATYQSGRRQKMELYYAGNASVIMDLRILLRTPGAVIRKRGVW